MRNGRSHAGRTWTRIICVASCLRLAFFLSACATPTPPPEPATVRFSYFEQLGQTETGYYELLLDEFAERYPYITVDLQPEGWYSDYDAVFFADFHASSGSQEFWSSLDALVEQDLAFDLSDFDPAILEMFTFDGELWGIPAGLDMDVMFYNQDLFDAYGVPYPEAGWTWDGFLDRALVLRDEEAGIYGYAPWGGYLDAILFIYQHGGRLADDLENPTRATFDDPLTVEALEWYAALVLDHNVAPTPQQARRDLGMGDENPQIGVAAGKVGMWISNFSDQGQAVGSWDFRWGMAPLPRDARAATLVWAWGYGIRSSAVDADACWRWIAFLSEQPREDYLPARRSLLDSAEYGRLAEREVARASLEGAELVSVTALTEWDEYETIQALGSTFDMVVRGNWTVEEALDAAQERTED